jgi:hypothetical protein
MSMSPFDVNKPTVPLKEWERPPFLLLQVAYVFAAIGFVICMPIKAIVSNEADR